MRRADLVPEELRVLGVTHCVRCGEPLDAETTTERVIERSGMHADCLERDWEEEER